MPMVYLNSILLKLSLLLSSIFYLSYLTIVNTKKAKSPIRIFGEAPETNSIFKNISVAFHEEYFFNPECLAWNSNFSVASFNENCDVFDAEKKFSSKKTFNLRRKQNSKSSKPLEMFEKPGKLTFDGEL